MSPGLRSKFDKLVKPKWLVDREIWEFVKNSEGPEDAADELWDMLMEAFWTAEWSKDGHIWGISLIKEYPDFVNALSLSEAMEIERLLRVWVDAVREDTLRGISEVLRIPKA